MLRQNPHSWQDNGARATSRARIPWIFVLQHIWSRLFKKSNDLSSQFKTVDISSEKQFWQSENLLLGRIRLAGLRLSDWFPRAPGVYWSEMAARARSSVWNRDEYKIDPNLGKYFTPKAKMSLIEEGGIGTIRLLPRKLDGIDCWLATATEHECHSGIPLAIPNDVLQRADVNWGDQVNLKGRVKTLQDAELEHIAASIHHARPLIVFVDEIEGVKAWARTDPIIITPVALFTNEADVSSLHNHAQYTYVQCPSGKDSILDTAVEWIERYAAKYEGRIITNFDEQRPSLSDAPLSYQRLIANTYDLAILKQFVNQKEVAQIVQIINQQNNLNMKTNNITVGGSAIIGIESTFTNVAQSIGSLPGLNSEGKSQLELSIQTLKEELKRIEANHAEESQEIADRLTKAITYAAKPLQDRKPGLIERHAKGLREAAEWVKDVAPNILTTAISIGKLLVGL